MAAELQVGLARIPRLTIATKVAYGAGGCVQAALETTHLYYFIPFFTIAMGMPATLVGVGAFVSVFLDAIIDPLMGHVSDKYQSRLWGRRHLFMLAGAPFIALFVYLLFTPPTGMSVARTFCWMVTFSLATRVAFTVNYIPYLSLGAELTTDFDERTEVANYRNFAAFTCGVTIGFFLLLVFLAPTPEHPSGWDNIVGYSKFAILAGSVALVGGLVAVFGTLHRVRYLPVARPDGADSPWHHAYTAMWRAMKLKSFRSAVGGWCGFTIMIGAHAALITTVNTYFWGLTASQNFLGVAAYAVAILPASILATQFARRLGKRRAAMVGVLGFVLIHLVLYLFSIGGVLAPVGSIALLATMLVFLTASLIFMATIYVTAFSMMADVTDELELVTERRQEGIIFAASAFGQKLSYGVGGLLAGIGLDLIHFPPGTDRLHVAREVLRNVGVLMGFGIPLLGLLPLGLFASYRLDRSRHAEIRELLDRRHAKVSGVE